jgi:hypothetical protein
MRSQSTREVVTVLTQSIPTTLSEITPAWLTWTLRDAGVIAGSTVTSVNAKVIGEERGFTGVVARLYLH